MFSTMILFCLRVCTYLFILCVAWYVAMFPTDRILRVVEARVALSKSSADRALFIVYLATSFTTAVAMTFCLIGLPVLFLFVLAPVAGCVSAFLASAWHGYASQSVSRLCH